MKIDRERSRALAIKIRAMPGQCWSNAIDAMWHLLDQPPPDGIRPPPGAGADHPALRLRYVEGYAGVEIGIPHGWLELDGTILDPTMPLWATDACRYVYYDDLLFSDKALIARLETDLRQADLQQLEPTYVPVRSYSFREVEDREDVSGSYSTAPFTEGLLEHKAKIEEERSK